MGEVIRLRGSMRRHRGPWMVADFKDSRPPHHPKVAYGPRGRVLLAVSQVWVEGHTQELWVIEELLLARDTFYPYDVVFSRYRSQKFSRRCLCEAGFRRDYEVWEEFLKSNAELMVKLDWCSRHDLDSPFRGRPDAAEAGRAFFGFDQNGHRIK